jgi:oligoribonuclease
MTNNDTRPTKLLWVDLEMTGLDSTNDLILEIAAVVTDFEFKELARYESRVKYDAETVQERMKLNEWWNNFPDNRDDFIQKLDQGKELGTVEEELLTFVGHEFGEETAILAGNSIHQDRKFIARWWPNLDKKLHYRMFDVTSLKIYMRGKYGIEYEKQQVHRALGDIQESMSEWQYYFTWLREHNGDA